MRIGLKIPHVIFFLLLLGSGDFQVRGMTVTGKDVPIEALRGENVTIPCLVSGVRIPLNLQILSVVWTLRLQNGSEHEVYGFRGSHHQSWRNGYHMNDRDLQQGNASLYIPNIQIEDDGEYLCFVIFTPDAGSSTSTLQVSVIPQNILSHDRLIEAGIPGYVRCYISNFYPEAVKIRLVKYSKSNNFNTSLDRDVFFTTPLRNSDGTFNVTSLLTVRPSSGLEPGDILFCIVSHRSLKEEMTQSFTMPRWNRFLDLFGALFVLSFILYATSIFRNNLLKRWRTWIYLLGTILTIVIIILICSIIYFLVDIGDVAVIWYIYFALLIYVVIVVIIHGKNSCTYFIKGDLTVSEISGEHFSVHMKETTLTCHITDFTPKEIQINVYLKRRNDIKTHLITSWDSTDWKSSNNSPNYLPMVGDQGDNVLPLLDEGARSRTLLSGKIKVEMTKSWTGMCKCLCSITITPDIKTDDIAVLGVEVEHASLKRPIYVYRTLYVDSTVSYINISDISGETWIPHMKRTTLSCQLTGFRSKDIHINLYLKRRNDMKKHLIHSWVAKDRPSDGNNATLAVGMEDTGNDTLAVEMEDTGNDTTLAVEMEDTGNDTMLPGEMEDAGNDTMLPGEMEDTGNDTTLAVGMEDTGNDTTLAVGMEDTGNDTTLAVEMEDTGNDTTLAVEMEDTGNDTMLAVEMKVKMTKTENRRYKYDCRISLTPNADTDDGAVLNLEINHAALEWPEYKYRALNVIKGDKPSLWRRWNKHDIK